MKVARSLYVCACTCARCWTVVSICRTVIIDCRIPRDGATLRALNTRPEKASPDLVHDAYEARARRRYASPSVYTLSSATASLPVSLSLLHPSRCRSHVRAIQRPRDSPREIHLSSRFSFSSFPTSSPSLDVDFENCFLILASSRIYHQPRDIRDSPTNIAGIRCILIHPAAAFDTNSLRKKLHHRRRLSYNR